MKSKTVGPCRECRRVMYLKCRGLCGTCWKDEGIRKRYEPKRDRHQYTEYRLKLIGEHGNNKDTKGPCPFPPGSPEKIQYLEYRALHNQPLHHPDDNTGAMPITKIELPSRFENARYRFTCPLWIESGDEVLG